MGIGAEQLQDEPDDEQPVDHSENEIDQLHRAKAGVEGAYDLRRARRRGRVHWLFRPHAPVLVHASRHRVALDVGFLAFHLGTPLPGCKR